MRKLAIGKAAVRNNVLVVNGLLGSRRSSFGSGVVVDPYAAHVAALRSAAPGASGYYTGRDYTASTSQAGLFVDAFGGALTYASPNVQASPTRVVDPATGMVYVSSDGADDTAIGSAAQKVAAYTVLMRSPQATWSSYGGPLETTLDGNSRLAIFSSYTTGYYGAPPARAVRKNGVDLPIGANPQYDLQPITAWMVVTVRTSATGGALSQVLQLCQAESGYNVRLHLACLLKWPTAPTAAEVQAAEAELTRYYGPLLANGSN